MDPAAFGTLTLGLNDARSQALEDDRPTRRAAERPRRMRRPRVAGALAGALRGLADVLEPGLDPTPRPAGRLTS
jgi:hypothetical protein